MSYLSVSCPYCHVENTSFKSIAEHRSINNKNEITVFYCCVHCDRGISVLMQIHVSDSPHKFDGDVRKLEYCQILDIQPKNSLSIIPDHLPQNIASFYKQAKDNLQRHNWDACGTMCRKVLDVSLAGRSKKARLVEKIDDLANSNLITQQLKEWAHSIRLDGNDASHESDPYGEHEANSLFDFMHVFVFYIYTMPGMLEERKKGNLVVE